MDLIYLMHFFGLMYDSRCMFLLHIFLYKNATYSASDMTTLSYIHLAFRLPSKQQILVRIALFSQLLV